MVEKMGFFAQIAFGNALTQFTNLEEELAQIRMATGAAEGDDLEMLPIARQRELEKKVPKWMSTLRSQPEHVVTRELMKNIQLNQRVGREQRVDVQISLLKRLVALGVAMDPDEFARLYIR